MSRQWPSLRGLAILIVVVHHSIDMGTLGPKALGYPPLGGWVSYALLALYGLGVFAVPTFLFISGCFAGYAAQGDPPKLSWKTVQVTLKRILRPYAIWSVVFYVVIHFERGESYSLLGYLKNLIVGYPFHFIPILVLCYLLSPFFARVSGGYPHVLIAVIAVYQVFLINVAHPGILGFAFPDWTRFLVPPIFGSTLAEWGLSFPLGMVYSLHSRSVLPWLRKLRWPLALGAVGCFLVRIPPLSSVVRWRWASYVGPVMFLLLCPTIRRGSIPLVRWLEKISRRSYGLYLTHLTVLHLVFWPLRAFAPWLLGYQAALYPILLVLALGIPLALMSGAARWSPRGAYQAVFG